MEGNGPYARVNDEFLYPSFPFETLDTLLPQIVKCITARVRRVHSMRHPYYLPNGDPE